MFISSTIPSIRLLPRLRGRGFPAEAGQDSESLTSLIERHDKRNANPNILLKIDIENDERTVFDTTPLDRLFQIVGEFHYLQGFCDTHWGNFSPLKSIGVLCGHSCSPRTILAGSVMLSMLSFRILWK